MIGILVGGKGSRIKDFKKIPKPLIKIKNREILKWIINIYTKNKLKKFILLCRSDNLEYFRKFKKKYNKIEIEIIDTGLNSETGKRISYLKKFINNDKFFYLTYGDALADFNSNSCLKKFKNFQILLNIYKKKLDYGMISTFKNVVQNFEEKQEQNINAGFYIIKKEILDYINYKNISFEKEVLPKFVKKKLVTFNIVKKWHPMDNKSNYYSIENWVYKNFKKFDFD